MNYYVHNFPQACDEFEEKHCINTVIHSYYSKNKLDAIDRSRCAFKSCLTKYEYGCEKTDCKYYDDREPIFPN